jgi:hypothetical protein
VVSRRKTESTQHLNPEIIKGMQTMKRTNEDMIFIENQTSQLAKKHQPAGSGEL